MIALATLGGLSMSCSVDNEEMLPVYSTGDEVDDPAEPDEDDY